MEPASTESRLMQMDDPLIQWLTGVREQGYGKDRRFQRCWKELVDTAILLDRFIGGLCDVKDWQHDLRRLVRQFKDIDEIISLPDELQWINSSQTVVAPSLYVTSSPTGTLKAAFTSKIIDERRRTLREDFSRPYTGQGAINLLEHVRHANIRYDGCFDGIYARELAILQSSGSGKTRTAIQLSWHELGMLVCVRDTNSSISEPPRDNEVASWLHGTGTIWKPAIPERFKPIAIPLLVTIQIAVWLEAYATELTTFYNMEWSSLYPDQPALPVQSSNSYLWDQFKQHVAERLAPAGALSGNSPLSSPSSGHGVVDSQSPRAAFLKRVDRAAASLGPIYYTLDALLTAFVEGEYAEPKAKKAISIIDAAYFYVVRPQRAFTQLEAILPPQTDSTDRHAKRNDAFCYLAIDECGKLGHRLHVLRRLWSYIAPNRTWIMLLDTTASISRTFGRKSFSSKVLSYLGKQHVEPFTGLPHDIELSANQDRYRRFCIEKVQNRRKLS